MESIASSPSSTNEEFPVTRKALINSISRDIEGLYQDLAVIKSNRDSVEKVLDTIIGKISLVANDIHRKQEELEKLLNQFPPTQPYSSHN